MTDLEWGLRALHVVRGVVTFVFVIAYLAVVTLACMWLCWPSR